ncbi:MAG: hypothetical protein R3C49_16625 [Planctomycetaceae bacterium]
MSAIISVLLIAVAYSVVPHFAVRSRLQRQLPLSIRTVVYVEVIYGIAQLLVVPTLLLPSIFGLVPPGIGHIGVGLTILFGMVWLVVAVNLQHGCPKSRIVWAVLSIARARNLQVSLLISLTSALLLLLPKASRLFFAESKDDNCLRGTQ